MKATTLSRMTNETTRQGVKAEIARLRSTGLDIVDAVTVFEHSSVDAIGQLHLEWETAGGCGGEAMLNRLGNKAAHLSLRVILLSHMVEDIGDACEEIASSNNVTKQDKHNFARKLSDADELYKQLQDIAHRLSLLCS